MACHLVWRLKRKTNFLVGSGLGTRLLLNAWRGGVSSLPLGIGMELRLAWSIWREEENLNMFSFPFIEYTCASYPPLLYLYLGCLTGSNISFVCFFRFLGTFISSICLGSFYRNFPLLFFRFFYSTFLFLGTFLGTFPRFLWIKVNTVSNWIL